MCFARNTHGIKSSDAKELACTLAVRSGNDRCVHVLKVSLGEKAVDSACKCTAHPCTRGKGTSARAQMGVRTQKLKTMRFLLQRIGFSRRLAKNSQVASAQLKRLPGAWGGDECTLGANAGAGSNAFERLSERFPLEDSVADIRDLLSLRPRGKGGGTLGQGNGNLKGIRARTVAQTDKDSAFCLPFGAHPTVNAFVLA